MFPTNGNDLSFEFNPESVLAAIGKVNKALSDMDKGVAGASTRASEAVEDMAKKMIMSSSRVEQAREREVRSLERYATTAGKTGIEKLIAQQDQMLSRYPKLADANEKQVQQINRIREAFTKLVAVQQQQEKGSGSGGFGVAFRAGRDLFEGRTAYGVVQAGQGIAGLSGAAALAGGLTAGLVGLTAASVASMKSLSELGVQVREVQLRTGLSTKEVGEFGFAAKAVGQDVSIFERMMRGLTQSVEDQTSAGEKGRQWLLKFGVDLRGLRDGTVGTADTLERIAMGAAGLSTFERSKAYLDLFKRAGIEAIPVMEELEKNLKIARDNGFGLTDEELKRFLQYKSDLNVIEGLWDKIVRNVKEYLALPIAGVIRAGMEPSTLSNPNRPPSGRVGPPTGTVSIDLGPPGPSAPGADAAWRIYGSLRAAQRSSADSAVANYQQGLGLNWQLQAAEKALGQLGAPQAGVSSAEDVIAYQAAQAKVESIKQAIKLKDEELEVTKKIAALEVSIAEHAGRPYGITKAEQEFLGIAKSPGVTSGQLQQAGLDLLPAFREETSQILRHAQAAAAADNLKLNENGFGMVSNIPAGRLLVQANEQANRSGELQVRSMEGALNYYNAGNLRGSESAARIAGILGPQTPASRLETERQISQIRIEASNEDYRQQKDLITAEYAGLEGFENLRLEKEEKLQELRIKNAEEVGKVQDQYAEEQAQELRRQIDEIKGPASKLFGTLFNHPGSFGREFSSTLREAVTRPAVNFLSEGTARFLQPLIFGGGGGGGLNNVSVTNGAMHVVVVGGGTSVYGGGGFLGGGLTGWSGSGGGLFGGFDLAQGLSGGPGGTSGFAGPVGGYSAPLGGGVASGGSPLGGLSRIFGGLSGSGLSSLAKNFGIGGALIQGAGNTAHLGGTSIGSVLSSKGAGSLELLGGSMLAQAGLLGGRRGTAAGIVESGIGGAGIGAGIGTMFLPGVGTAIGAGIGAAAGTLAGLGERLAGVESPQNEAKRLVRAQYHISINTAEANQIVQLAASKYGNTVSIAVRSPEVRQMLGLYAAGTGQAGAFPQSADTPHGASLINSGGKLFQQSTYLYGNAYTQQSNLPIYGGGNTGTYPSPGVSPQIALSISGAAVAPFLTGNFVTPDFVGSQFASAMSASNNRMQNAMTFDSPGEIVA